MQGDPLFGGWDGQLVLHGAALVEAGQVGPHHHHAGAADVVVLVRIREFDLAMWKYTLGFSSWNEHKYCLDYRIIASSVRFMALRDRVRMNDQRGEYRRMRTLNES